MVTAKRIPPLATVALAMACLQGCGGYDKVSPTTYQFAKSLYAITNQRAAIRLDEFKAKAARVTD